MGCDGRRRRGGFLLLVFFFLNSLFSFVRSFVCYVFLLYRTGDLHWSGGKHWHRGISSLTLVL